MKLFSDQQTWFPHELKDHRKEWNCHFCAHTPFDKSTTYHAHLTAHHPQSFSKDQLPALFEMSQKPLLKVSPSDCPFCDDWDNRLRAVNPHISKEESLVVTPSQFEHHVGAHMVQLALFAIPRGHTEEGDADSGNVAPPMDSDALSLSEKSLAPMTVEQLRQYCEDILSHSLMESVKESLKNVEALPFHFPTFSLLVPTLGMMRVSPMDLAMIHQKLKSGVYSHMNHFWLDILLYFAIHQIRSSVPELRLLHSVNRQIFCQLWTEFPRGRTFPDAEPSYILDETFARVQWKLWRASQIKSQPGEDVLEACTLDIQIRKATKIRRRFLKSTNFEEVFALVECYELVKGEILLP